MTQHDEHMDTDKYARYHRVVWLPDYVEAAAHRFLPPKRTVLPLSPHYERIMGERELPRTVYMPRNYEVIEATVVRETAVIFRVLMRFGWKGGSDFCAVLEGDYQLLTGYWANPNDTHPTLDKSVYEQPTSHCPGCGQVVTLCYGDREDCVRVLHSND